MRRGPRNGLRFPCLYWAFCVALTLRLWWVGIIPRKGKLVTLGQFVYHTNTLPHAHLQNAGSRLAARMHRWLSPLSTSSRRKLTGEWERDLETDTLWCHLMRAGPRCERLIHSHTLSHSRTRIEVWASHTHIHTLNYTHTHPSPNRAALNCFLRFVPRMLPCPTFFCICIYTDFLLR